MCDMLLYGKCLCEILRHKKYCSVYIAKKTECDMRSYLESLRLKWTVVCLSVANLISLYQRLLLHWEEKTLYEPLLWKVFKSNRKITSLRVGRIWVRSNRSTFAESGLYVFNIRQKTFRALAGAVKCRPARVVIEA